MTVQLDLRNLTRELLAEAEPHCGKACKYTAPCIIGALVPKDQRARLDNHPEDASIVTLLTEDWVSMPANQRDDAIAMQQAFDSGSWFRVKEIASRYIAQSAPHVG